MLLKRSIRDKDILSHWNGDTFMIYFPQIIEDDLNAIAKAIVENIKKLPFPLNKSFTCCISMVEVSTEDTLETVLNNLETRMRDAKNANTSSVIMTNGRLLHIT